MMDDVGPNGRCYNMTYHDHHNRKVFEDMTHRISSKGPNNKITSQIKWTLRSSQISRISNFRKPISHHRPHDFKCEQQCENMLKSKTWKTFKKIVKKKQLPQTPYFIYMEFPGHKNLKNLEFDSLRANQYEKQKKSSNVSIQNHITLATYHQLLFCLFHLIDRKA